MINGQCFPQNSLCFFFVFDVKPRLTNGGPFVESVFGSRRVMESVFGQQVIVVDNDKSLI